METKKNTVDEKEIIESLNRTMQYGNSAYGPWWMRDYPGLNRTMQYGNFAVAYFLSGLCFGLNRTMQYGNLFETKNIAKTKYV